MEQAVSISALAADTINGLSSSPKYLLPRYFYDDRGSRIFQDIMKLPEYYLTECEYEILNKYSTEIAEIFTAGVDKLDLIELGAGDGVKTRIVADQLFSAKVDFSYLPVDISREMNEELASEFRKAYKGLDVKPITGDYFHLMEKLSVASVNRKLIMFLGSNMGNFSDKETYRFLENMNNLTRPGDRLLIGLDLKKSPEVIMKAYHDKEGYTREFNLNLLRRLNEELGADFNPDEFEHHTQYNPVSGDVKSFLVSRKDQEVKLSVLDRVVNFSKWEPLFMERSRKFDLETISCLAERHGFMIEKNFTDNRGYFVDSVWIKRTERK